MRTGKVVALVSLILCGGCGGAAAATSTANLNVTIKITAGCSLSIANVDFGTVSASNLTNAIQSPSATLSYACSAGTVPALTFGQGANYSGTNRLLGSATGAFLPYTLAATAISGATTSNGSYGITARIPAQAAPPAVDTYNDTVVVTLTY